MSGAALPIGPDHAPSVTDSDAVALAEIPASIQREPMGGRDTALALMKMALALLDAAERYVPAIHLQAAIDAAEGNGPMREGEILPIELEERILGPMPSENL